MMAPMLEIFRLFWRNDRWLLAGTALVALASALTGVLTPYLFSRLIDALAISEMATVLVWAFAGYALLRGLTSGLDYCVSYLSIMAAENLNFIAATAFFGKLLAKPVSFFIEHNPVEIQSARQEGQRSVYMMIQLVLIVFLPSTTLIALSIAMLGAVINAELVLIVVVYGVVFVGLTYWANHWTRPLLDAAIEANQENAKFVGNAVNAMETLRYFNGDRWISSQFTHKAGEARGFWVQWAQRRIGLSLVFGLALAAQLAMSFVLLLPRYQAGELSIGDFVLINTLLIQLNRPFEMIGSSIDTVMRAISGFRPFAKLWNTPDDHMSAGKTQLTLTEGRLAFEGVSFAYGDNQILSDVSFVAERGRVTYLAGETGAGKSTAFKLALKAIEPQAGRITIDGIELGTIDRESWYASVGVVPQDVMLLNDTLAANIVLGRDYDLAQLRKVAEKARILGFINGLDEGFATAVGERGLKLSGGERQRVAIARALYGDPKILLLDEASSALDETTEAAIMAELRELDNEVTIVAITHRRSVIAPTDRIVEFIGGSGTRQTKETKDEDADAGQDWL